MNLLYLAITRYQSNQKHFFQNTIKTLNICFEIHICFETLLKSNDLKLKSNCVVQQKKFCNLLKEIRSTQDPGTAQTAF